ncbi:MULTISPECIES: CdaR family protein [Staphylococcus]|uniref:Secreted protein n=1 Tax=Staphylococcus schleiferi TaxID=1295 RepID=A0A7Z7QNI1_STASC|nr:MULTISPECIES: CdaR family protein [Staphylococcus]QGS45972.1 YbbR-like domain-containing protein [Mammaliicoccus fleurettii]EPD48164.1 hypothetical protein HMPREF1208_02214 [Staphylococcus sp. HGB0015]NHA34977.1 hypothetical protein [Staphylococcus schleiferi]NHA39526.1 hypothetical protein [Staphylococcus schleiferi]NHA41718.1 hypothetical protein [Staphylococcus schleiferi]
MFESKWGLRFFAFILALLLFLSVNNVFGTSFSTDNISNNGNKTIKNAHVEVINNDKNLYVSGAPDTVDVELTGPQSKVLQAQKTGDIKVVLDASDIQPGEHTLEFQVRGLDKDINYHVYPKEATLSVEKKETRTYAVEPNVSPYAIDSNFKLKDASVSPHTVKVIGGKEQLDRIAFVKASFRNENDIKEKTTGDANVAVFDKNMNKLDVQIEPSTVELTADVEPYSKKVKLDVSTKGNPTDGLKVADVSLDTKEIEIFGNREALQDISEVSGEIDVNGISSDTEKEVKLTLPENVTKLEPDKVKAKIKVQ